MNDTDERSGRATLKEQGFALTWSPQGLKVEVLDYHAKELRLSWDLLLELAEKGQGGNKTGH